VLQRPACDAFGLSRTGEADAATGYVVEFPGAAPARINPVNGPAALRGQCVAE